MKNMKKNRVGDMLNIYFNQIIELKTIFLNFFCYDYNNIIQYLFLFFKTNNLEKKENVSIDMKSIYYLFTVPLTSKLYCVQFTS